jgi:hypothetical protein
MVITHRPDPPIAGPARARKPVALAFGGLLACLVLALYAPAVHYGLIWDDPRYYAGVRAQAGWLQIFSSPQPPTFQFYRPLAVLYGHLLIGPDGVVNAPLAHTLQIGTHLAATLALIPVLRAFRLRLTHARLAALCFAVFPFSYYGVAWQQNQQPLVVLWLLLALLAAARYCTRRSPVYLALSSAAYGAALLFQEGAAPFLALFWWLAWDRRRGGTSLWQAAWPLAHTAVVAAYALVWLSMPAQRSVTGAGFEPIVLAYFAQGLVFPLASLLEGWLSAWPAVSLLLAFGVAWALLALGLWRLGLGRSALLGSAWVALGILPLWAGLSWGYAQLGARLLYPAAVGVAVLWGGWTTLAFSRVGWQRALGVLALAAVLVVSLRQWWEFQRLFATSTAHLARAVAVLAQAPGRRALFVNFPDRLELRQPPYPLGFWGLVLAPVVEDLQDYAVAARGQSAADRSVSSFVTGAGDRDAWAYRVDMRGSDAGPIALFEAARWADAVYLTEYEPQGQLKLLEVGHVQAAAGTPALARVGESVELVEAALVRSSGLELRLTWRCLRPLRVDDTILIHFWQGETFVGGADGDSLGGLIPPAAWQPGTETVERRYVDLEELAPGTYQVRVGLYNRGDGLRYLPESSDPGRVRADEVIVGEFSVP